MVDKFYNNQKILVNADYDNITLIDPNKIVDSDGKVQDRLVNHEELVKYVNLEAVVIPRTKLIAGENFEDSIQNIRIGTLQGQEDTKINFLKGRYSEGDLLRETDRTKLNNYFDTNWTDSFTIKDGKNSNDIDSQLMGITDVSIKISSSYVPVVNIEMVDVQGRVLFEQGENSPYSAFMQQPYPLFYLTVKGYYGKAIRYELMLETFNASFDPTTGNYKVSTQYKGRTFALLSDISLGNLYSLPHMYHKKIEISSTQNTNLNEVANSGGVITEENFTKQTTKGKDLLRNVYSQYRDKGLIGDDFPDQQTEPMTLAVLSKKLDNFERYVMEVYGQEDLSILTDITEYSKILTEYRQAVYKFSTKTWFNKYIDSKNTLIPNETGKSNIYPFKSSLTLQDRFRALNELKSIIEKYNTELSENVIFGSNGEYTIKTKTTQSSIPNNIKYEDLIANNVNLDNINYFESFIFNQNRAGTDAEVQTYKTTVKTAYEVNSIIVDVDTLEPEDEQLNRMLFKFGDIYDSSSFENNTFLSKINNLQKIFESKKKTIEDELSNALAEKIRSNDIGLGFNPTINNVLAVICANADAYLKLMDYTHKQAWEQRNNKVRISAVLGDDKSNGIDSKDMVSIDDIISESSPNQISDSKKFVYPWPQYYEIEIDEDGNEKLIDKYPGDPSILSKTQGYRYDVWPEIEFVEEYIQASLQTEEIELDLNYENQYKQTKFIPFNPIEFPFENKPYVSLQEIDFFYELYERSLLYSKYNKLDVSNGYTNELFSVLTDFEFLNINESVLSSPDLIIKLKEFQFTYENLLNYLKNISNPGRWNKTERGYFTNEYIKNLIDNDFGIFKETFLDEQSVSIDTNTESSKKLNNFLSSTESNQFSFLTSYPLKNLTWLNQNVSDGYGISTPLQSNSTTKTLSFLETKKTIASFKYDDGEYLKKPFTYFNWITQFAENPYNTVSDIESAVDTDGSPNITTIEGAKKFFQTRTIKKYNLTESKVDYSNTYDSTVNNLRNRQTTSFLNTPYFINALLKGVENEKNGIENPYVGLGYLYLNSLPLTTLKEKVKSFENNNVKELDYLYSVLSKYSAIHKLPYLWVLKYGSIYHRYKKYYTTEIDGNPTDILDDIWKDFDNVTNYDPITNDQSKIYDLVDGKGYSWQYYQKFTETTVQGEEFTQLSNGFYPKVINDIYWYFTNQNIFSGYTNEELSTVYSDKKLKTNILNSKSIYFSGYRPDNPNSFLEMKNWYAYFEIKDNYDFAEFDEDKILVVPSMGYMRFNQPRMECFNEAKKMTDEILDNQSVYNGTVRSLWNSPNYGFYDNSKIKKPEPNQYIKNIYNNNSNPQPFDLLDDVTQYSNIEEMFAVFPKKVLEEFEKHFLNFCLPKNQFNSNLVNRGTVTVSEFFDTPTIKEQFPDGMNTSNLLEVLNLYENSDNKFTSGIGQPYIFSLYDVIKSIFIIDKPTIIGDGDIDSFNISKKQLNNFNAKHVQEFLSKNIILKIGNAGQYDERVFTSFSNNTGLQPVDKINFGGYVEGTLPTETNGVTVSQSKSLNPDAWKELYLSVGLYSDEKLNYNTIESYITQFFIDFDVEFNRENVEILTPIIKTYISEKINNNDLTVDEFYVEFNNFINSQIDFQKNILDNLFIKLNGKLPTVKVISENKISDADGNVTKLELWKSFQYMNDRWISGQDFENRTIFEEFLFVDKANRPVGDKITIDIEKLRLSLKGKNSSKTLYQLVGEIIRDNSFLFIPTPVYANFYGLNARVRNGKPVESSSSKIASDLFGTFMDVDIRDTRPKMLAIYIDQVSQNLNFRNNKQIKRLDDATDLSNPSNNALKENQTNKQDYSNSNKCVGFNIDFGLREQGIFKSISMDMKQFKNTSEVYQVYVDMANQASGQQVAQQTVSLYNVYKNRSYTCNVVSMGNVMIQPTTYFNLRNVPIFNGPYLITEVNHTINANDFTTQFEGVRISKYGLPQPDKLVASVNREILKSYENKLRKQKQSTTETDEVENNDEVVINENDTETTTNTTDNNPTTQSVSTDSECENNTKHPELDFLPANSTYISRQNIIDYLVGRTDVDAEMRRFVYGLSVREQGSGTQIRCYNNNMFGIELGNGRWSNSMVTFMNGQICVNVTNEPGGVKTKPFASFNSFQDSTSMVLSRYKNSTTLLTELNPSHNSTTITNSIENRAIAMTRLYMSTWNLGYGLGSNSLDIINKTNEKYSTDSTFRNKYDISKNTFTNILNSLRETSL